VWKAGSSSATATLRTPPKDPPKVETVNDPTFKEFADRWWAQRHAEWREATRVAYRWEVFDQLMPFFGDHRLGEITFAEVDRFKTDRLAARAAGARLSNTSINMILGRLAQILAHAKRLALIDANPMGDGGWRLKQSRSRRAYLDRATWIEAMLTAAGELDREARADRRHVPRRALVAMLMFTGLRIGEALALRWRDVDLSAGRLRVPGSKTSAGERWVPLLPALRDELASLKAARAGAGPDALLFASATGRQVGKDNARNRIFARVVERADRILGEAGEVPLPEGLTPHSLRHTYISLRMALGDDLAVVSADAGHANIGVTYRIYTHVMRLGDAERGRLRALVEGGAVDAPEAAAIAPELP
jgi:integrase